MFREEGRGVLMRNCRGQHPNKHMLKINKDAFKNFLEQYAALESELLAEKAKKSESFFPDDILMSATRRVIGESTLSIDMESYKAQYYAQKFPKNTSVKQICHEYLKGLQWVMNYYVYGIPSWTWCYPYYYGPFLSDLVEHIQDFNPKTFTIGEPVLPFEQLMMVLPLKSAHNILPKVFHHSLENELGEFFSEDFKIDLSGKRKEWEGIVLLPRVETEKFKTVYDDLEHRISDYDSKRNKKGFTFVYKSGRGRELHSKYGNLIDNNCCRYKFNIDP